MSNQLSTGRIATLLICVAIGMGPRANAQDIFGEFLGPVLEAGAGEVLNRAGGQILEGALNGRGGISSPGRPRLRRPGGRQRGPMQPSQPSRNYSQPQPVFSQPVPIYSQPAPVYSQPIEEATPASIVEDTRPAPVEPPANEIPVTQRLQPNASPLDFSLTHVLDQGPYLALRVMQVEAESIFKKLDDAVVRQLRRAGQSEPMVASFRAVTQTPTSSADRQAWLANQQETMFDGKTSVVITVDASALTSELASSSPQVSFAERQEQIDALREKISKIPASMLGGEDLALTAERVRNLRNISLLAELARITGVERRKDLFARIRTAVVKSDAPDEFVSLLTGFALPIETVPVSQASIPSATPKVAIHNPLSSNLPVRFTIEEQGEFTLHPGDTAAGNETVIIGFDNGQGDTKRYTLRDGFFQWKIKDGTWDIRKKTTVKFLIDASDSQLPFHYLVDGEPMVVQPGEMAEHSSEMPPRIDFDRGLGDGSFATKLLNPGRFSVKVDSETGAFDLYPAEDDSTGQSSTTGERVRQAWRDSVAEVRNDRNAGVSGPVDQALDSLLNEIE